MSELLRGYSRVRSTDVDEFCEAVSQITRPFSLDAHAPRIENPMVFNSAQLGDITVSYKSYGVPVRIRHEPLDSFVLVYFSLAGSLSVRGGKSETLHDRRVAAVIDSDRSYDTGVDADAEGLLLRVERSALNTELYSILGRAPASRLRLDPSLDMTVPQALSMLSLLRALCADLDGPQGIRHPALQIPAQRFVIAHLLTTLRHSASDELAGIGSAKPKMAGLRTIRRADQMIRDHCHEPLTVSDIAEAVGISVRSLQSGFRRYLDTSPLERLRQARLAAAHTELLRSDPARVTVSQIAAKWGFHHVGRFSQHYRTAFGETPSQTLRL